MARRNLCVLGLLVCTFLWGATLGRPGARNCFLHMKPLSGVISTTTRSDVSFECDATCLGPLSHGQLRWKTQRDTLVPNLGRYRVHTVGYYRWMRNRLVIRSVGTEDSGVYTCEVQHRGRSMSYPVTLHVEEDPNPRRDDGPRRGDIYVKPEPEFGEIRPSREASNRRYKSRQSRRMVVASEIVEGDGYGREDVGKIRVRRGALPDPANSSTESPMFNSSWDDAMSDPANSSAESPMSNFTSDGAMAGFNASMNSSADGFGSGNMSGLTTEDPGSYSAPDNMSGYSNGSTPDPDYMYYNGSTPDPDYMDYNGSAPDYYNGSMAGNTTDSPMPPPAGGSSTPKPSATPKTHGTDATKPSSSSSSASTGATSYTTSKPGGSGENSTTTSSSTTSATPSTSSSPSTSSPTPSTSPSTSSPTPPATSSTSSTTHGAGGSGKASHSQGDEDEETDFGRYGLLLFCLALAVIFLLLVVIVLFIILPRCCQESGFWSVFSATSQDVPQSGDQGRGGGQDGNVILLGERPHKPVAPMASATGLNGEFITPVDLDTKDDDDDDDDDDDGKGEEEEGAKRGAGAGEKEKEGDKAKMAEGEGGDPEAKPQESFVSTFLIGRLSSSKEDPATGRVVAGNTAALEDNVFAPASSTPVIEEKTEKEKKKKSKGDSSSSSSSDEDDRESYPSSADESRDPADPMASIPMADEDVKAPEKAAEEVGGAGGEAGAEGGLMAEIHLEIKPEGTVVVEKNV